MSKVSSKKNIKTNKVLEECGICCEEITNKGKKVLIECPACEFKCCRVCIERWLLSELEPSCMKCKSKWTKVKCQELLGKGFMNSKHRNHVKNILFDIEKARFPETMPQVEIVVKKNKYVEMNDHSRADLFELQQQIKKIEKTIRDREYFIAYGHERGETHDNSTERKKFMKACPKNDCEGFLSSAWKCAVCECHVCKDCEVIVDDKNTHTCDPNILASAKLLKKETKPCPSCASSIYKISGCDQMWCTQCHIAFSWNTGKKVRGHVHNPHYYEWIKNGGGEAVMPGAMLPCGGLPTAYAVREALRYISIPARYIKPGNKIDSKDLFTTLQNSRDLRYLFVREVCLHSIGCKWFDINSKRIFFPSDDGREIVSYSISDRIYPNEKGSSEEIKNRCSKERIQYDENIKESIKISDTIRYLRHIMLKTLNVHQAISHFVNVELERQRRKVNNNGDSSDLRIKFIMKEIDEKRMKTSLLKRDRARDKEVAILDIFELYARVCSDSIRAICQDKNSLTIDKLIEEYNKIQRINLYCNKELLKYNMTFNLVTPEINLSNGWCQPRGPLPLAKYVDPEKIYRMRRNLLPDPPVDSQATQISVFDINFIKKFIQMRHNISRFGRRWSLIISQHSQSIRNVKHYKYLDRRGNLF